MTSSGEESLATRAEVAGDYRVTVAAGSAGLRGRYRLQVTELRPGVTLDRPRALGEQAVAEGIQLYLRVQRNPGRPLLRR